MKTRIALALACCALAGAFASVPTGPAQAQGFFERLFGPQPRSERERGYRVRRYDDRGNWGWGSRDDRRERARYRDYDGDPEPVHVKSPTYYTYQPDVLKTVSLSNLAEVETASNGPIEGPLDPTSFGQARKYLAGFTVRVLPEVGAALKAYYGGNPGFVWISDGAVNAKARDAIAALERADAFGLNHEDYAVSVPDLLGDSDERMKALVRFEMNLSAKVLSYVLDATRGRVDPNRISGYHDFDRKTVDLTGTLKALAQGENAGERIEDANPDNAPFKALAAELDKLREADDQTVVSVKLGTFFRPGASDEALPTVVAAIRRKASSKLKLEHAETLANYSGSSSYSDDLVALVRDFQKENSLRPDGIIGRNTVSAMKAGSPALKLRKVQLAMERLRWLPRKLGARHVLINQPAFTASFVQSGKKPLTMRVVVGKKSNQTNFFMDKIETVEFNPYWGVPRSIIVNEMVPKLYQDPGYLDRLGYEVSRPGGQQVSSWDVDWRAVAANAVPINVRQPPGKGNALGELKILFPNKHHIYMHDTPQKSFFQRDARALSHGCVRLQHPREMAAAVLGKPVSYVNNRIAQGQNESDVVNADIMVYVAYFTAWQDEEGGPVQYFDDVYDRDTYLARAVERTKAARRIEG